MGDRHGLPAGCGCYGLGRRLRLDLRLGDRWRLFARAGRNVDLRRKTWLKSQHFDDRVLEVVADALTRRRVLLQAIDIRLAWEGQHQQIVAQREWCGRVDDHPGGALGLLDGVQDLRPGVLHLLEGDRGRGRWVGSDRCYRRLSSTIARDRS